MIVVDTSVVLKWFVPEEGSLSALALLGRVMIAPDLLQAELGNVLAKKVRRRELAVEQARSAFSAAPDLLSLLPMGAWADDAFAMSLELVHEIYDCYFLAVARAHDAVLVTADGKFANKVRTSRYARLIAELEEPLSHG